MEKSIVIIGAGMGGLAAGIYGRMDGWKTTIFEQHTKPGGQCASWKRKGYTFDGCTHHLFGCDPWSQLYSLWEDLGAMPRGLVNTTECVSVESPNGRMFYDYWDPNRLEEQLKEIAPEDARVIEEYARAIPIFAKEDFFGDVMMAKPLQIAKNLPNLMRLLKWFKPTMRDFGDRFSNQFLRRTVPLLEYSLPDAPAYLHMVKHAYGYKGAIAWPVGASIDFAQSIEKRYRELGGEIHYKQKVKEILTDFGKAVGVRLEDGTEVSADYVISNADGRKTIEDMLGGRYGDERIKKWCREPEDETPWAVHVFLGVDRDLSREPSALVLLLDQPLTVGGHTTESVEMQIYGMDPSMAPPGKGVIKVELVSGYSYWKKLYEEGAAYREEKEKVAEAIISLLDSTHFSGLKGQVEVVDVPTLMTWERYVGGTHGFLSMPNKKFNPVSMVLGRLDSTLPGLSNFYLVGTWATSIGALFANALSGKKIIASL